MESAHAFKESLALAFIKGNLTHVQGNIILETLHTLSHFAYLPRDTRTLLNTPRVSPQVRNIFPGKYLHIGLQKALTRILLKTSPHLIPDILHIDWNTDGARLNKSGSMQIWPIQCLVANVECCKPEIVGIYKGSRKPASIDEFLNEFIEDVLHIIENDGIVFLQKQIPVTLRAFIADAPARSWLLNHFGHTSSHPCSKCRVIGTFYDGQMVSTGIKHRIRTDNEYARLVDDDHHKGPLSRLLLGLVSQVPVEYMHLICIGVAKKLLIVWVTGKYGKKMKLSGRNQSQISKRLECIAQYCPREFSRKPRSLSDYKDFKATEGRQFILYTGPVALQGIMDDQGYKHFLLLHAAIRALCSSTLLPTMINFAKLALEKFVETCSRFYKLTFLSYNVHALLHLAQDAERLGPLDTFSAFSYENNMTFFRTVYRKPNQSLQQFALRQAEREKKEEFKPRIANAIKVFKRHVNGPLLPAQLSSHCVQYKKLQTEKFFINVDSLSDRCIMLNNRSMCVVRNIVEIDDIYYLIFNKFQIVEDLYVAVPSSALETVLCSALSNDLAIASLNDVKAKCYLMPYWRVQSSNGSDVTVDEGEEFVPDTFVVSSLIN